MDSLEAGMLPGASAHARAPHRVRRDPARAPARSGAREEELVLETLRSGRLSLGPRLAAFEAAFAADSRLDARLGRLARHRRPAPRHPRRGHRAGRRGRHHAVQLRRVGQLPALRGRDAGVLRHRPAHAQHRRRTRPARRVDGAHHRAAAGAHLRLPGRHAGARAAGRATAACGSWRTPARRSAPCTPTARRWARAATCSVFGFYPNKQITTGEGGAVVSPSAEAKERIDSERNQGRAPDMGWLDHDRLGFNYRLDDLSCALGRGAARAPRRAAGRPRAGGGAVLGGAGGRRGARPALPGRGRRPAQLVRLRGAAAARRGPRRRGRRDARARRGHEALPAGDPPDELLPRALRPPRGRVPGLRGRGRAARWRCPSSRS